MMTDLAEPLALGTQRTRSPRARTLGMLVAGVLGGLGLGIIARAWMRLITEDPEFTWTGTIFIVIGFMVFGLTQSIVAVARRRPKRRWKLTIVRAVGAVGMLPLFVAAGALMLPTVVGGGLAVARVDWHTLTRSIWLLLAAAPVLFVGSELIDAFGWSMQMVAGFVMMSAVYSTIIWATRWTFAPQSDSP